MSTAPPSQRRRIWDAPVRVFHWSLAACFGALWLTREAQRMDLHAAAGYAMAALIVFRLLWGFVGGWPARFAAFAHSPAAALRYLRQSMTGRAPEFLSHNPAGSWSVYLLLGSATLGVVSGVLLIAAEHGLGPLAPSVSVLAAPTIHSLHEIVAWAMVALFCAHIAGVVVGSLAHRQNLLLSMVSGHKDHVPADLPPVRSRALVAFVLALGLAGGLYTYLGRSGWTESYATARAQAKQDAAAAVPGAWGEECGSCHLAYPAQLLPARSWQRMLREQDAHFGESLGLKDERLAELEALALEPAPARWAGATLQASVAPAESPQRITETGFWRERHRRLQDAEFKSDQVSGKHDCAACHADAFAGAFSPRLIRIPTIQAPP